MDNNRIRSDYDMNRSYCRQLPAFSSKQVPCIASKSSFSTSKSSDTLLGTTVNGKPSKLRISFLRGDADARITGLTTLNFIIYSPFLPIIPDKEGFENCLKIAKTSILTPFQHLKCDFNTLILYVNNGISRCSLTIRKSFVNAVMAVIFL